MEPTRNNNGHHIPASTPTVRTAAKVQTVQISPGTTLSMHSGCRVLLVEDGLDNARLVSTLLEQSGACVTIAENGQIGVDLAMKSVEQGQSFDVILMDMNMPVMDGYTATALLRDRGYIGPIIAITSNNNPQDREKCLAAGCDEYTAKPVSKQSLVSLTSDWSQNDDTTGPVDHLANKALVSVYANDPEKSRQIEGFVKKISVIVEAMKYSFERENNSMLSAMARQLKGAAKGYGFPMISKAAAAVEHCVVDGIDRDVLGDRVDNLSQLCAPACV